MEDSCGLHETRIENITVFKDNQTILEDVSFDVHCGQITMIIGKNGSGKTTLLKAILGEIPHSGKVEFFDMKEKKQKQIKIGYVPQHLNIERDMPTTVYDMCASYMSNNPVWLKKDKKLYEEIKTKLKKFGADKIIDTRVGNISGGELQRVLLAIATNPTPNLLILDEPVSAIDRNGTIRFYEILKELKNNDDLSIILVSHDLDLVKEYADKVVLLDNKVIKQGTAEEVFSSSEFIDRFGKM